MAAILCRKRSFLEADLPTTSLPASKKLCCKPFSPPKLALLAKLRELFPDMEQELLEKALDECGNNIDSVIKKLNDLNLQQQQPSEENQEEGVATEWVDMIIREMMSATSVDDAQFRASKVLQHVCRSVRSSNAGGTEAARVYQNESRVLKEQIEVLVRDNSTLKSLAVELNERQKDYDDNKRELEQLKELVSQGQE